MKIKGWWKGELNGKVGLFPSCFVKALPVGTVLGRERCLVCNDYAAQNGSEITLRQGQIIKILMKVGPS